MKRLIYSIFNNNVDEHTSINDYKRSQFKKYKNNIKEAQNNYAKMCSADYKLFNTKTKNYNDIQFEKVFLFEELSEKYDEILYLDFDVIPKTRLNFFNHFDLNYLQFYYVEKPLYISDLPIDGDVIRWRELQQNGKVPYSYMDPYVKMCAKNAMLLLDDISGHNGIINTGVFAGNKNSIKLLKFKERLNEIDTILEEAKEDCIYPDSMASKFMRNNEAYFTYIIERYDIPYNDIGTSWNYCLYEDIKNAGHNCDFLHYIGKHFHNCFT